MANLSPGCDHESPAGSGNLCWRINVIGRCAQCGHNVCIKHYEPASGLCVDCHAALHAQPEPPAAPTTATPFAGRRGAITTKEIALRRLICDHLDAHIEYRIADGALRRTRAVYDDADAARELLAEAVRAADCARQPFEFWVLRTLLDAASDRALGAVIRYQDAAEQLNQIQHELLARITPILPTGAEQ